jgi:Rrf2 family iron-sulfur cluster assembly transcriptional regulator
MKISTKGRFAITAMMELAIQENQRPVTLAEISADQSISISYLEQLFAKLRSHGLVKGMRGPGGGYTLARNARDVSVAEILLAVDEKAYSVPRADMILPADPHARTIQRLWTSLSTRIHDFLDNLSLEDVTRDDSLLESLADEKAA